MRYVSSKAAILVVEPLVKAQAEEGEILALTSANKTNGSEIAVKLQKNISHR
jgi:hypothetical protein